MAFSTESNADMLAAALEKHFKIRKISGLMVTISCFLIGTAIMVLGMLVMMVQSIAEGPG